MLCASNHIFALLADLPYGAAFFSASNGTLLCWNTLFAQKCPLPPKEGSLLAECGIPLSLDALPANWHSLAPQPLMVRQVSRSDEHVLVGLAPSHGWAAVCMGDEEELLDTIPAVVTLHNADGTLIACNKAFCSYFNVGRDEVLGKPTGTRLMPRHTTELRNAIAGCAADGERRYVIVCCISDGTEKWLQITLRPVSAPDGTRKVLTLSADITRHRKLEQDLVRRDVLMQGTNESAQILLSSQDNFDDSVNRVLALLGKITEADRVYVWNIHKNPDNENDPELYTSQLYEWSLGADPQQDKDICINRPVSETIPTWIDTFMSGKCVNSLVKNMPQAEQEQLAPQGILSILTAPIFFHGELWGFIGFDDCHSEYAWTVSDENILMAAGSLLGSAIYNSRINEALRESEARFSMSVEASGEIIWSLDGLLRLDYVSQKCRAVLGYEPEELLGKPFTLLCPAEEGFVPTPENNILHEIITEVPCKDGSMRWFQSSCIFVFDSKGQCYNAHGNSLDITETVKSHEEVRKAKNALEEANERLIVAAEVAHKLAEEANKANVAKSDFLANMSHELRTPLNAVVGMVHLIRKTELTKQQTGYLSNIIAASDSLLQIINDIIDFSRISSDYDALELAPFDLSEMVEAATAPSKRRAEEKGLAFSVEIAPVIAHKRFIADEVRLGRIVSNLAVNAVKFTHEGKVAVRVWAETTTSEGAMLHFAVKDTGIGISPKEQQKLFTAFMQVDTSSTRRYGGTGIGLALSKKFATLMSGSLWCESTSAVGSTFHFTIPLRYADKEGQPPVAVEPLNEDQLLEKKLRGRTLLLVEDNEINQLVAQEILEQVGMRVTIANNGREALDILESQTFDAILMDIQMPEMDGLTASRAIRRHKQFASLPIIALTAHARPEDKKVALEAGMNAHITKPIDPRILLRSIAERI